MPKKLYNVWLCVETVIVDEDEEELDWPDNYDVDEAKLWGLMEAEEAESYCNALLTAEGSSYDIRIPREEPEDETQP